MSTSTTYYYIHSSLGASQLEHTLGYQNATQKWMGQDIPHGTLIKLLFLIGEEKRANELEHACPALTQLIKGTALGSATEQKTQRLCRSIMPKGWCFSIKRKEGEDPSLQEILKQNIPPSIGANGVLDTAEDSDETSGSSFSLLNSDDWEVLHLLGMIAGIVFM
jgi:hypothetical protein